MATERKTMALNGVPGPEVVAKPKRRQFTAAYRLRILEEAERCGGPRARRRRFATCIASVLIVTASAGRLARCAMRDAREAQALTGDAV